MDGTSTRVKTSHGVFLALESQRLLHAFAFDPMLAMSTSKVDSLPHQIEAVYEHVLKKPRIRFMLAHDPGAGKTIMAGLVLKDMMMRNKAKRILVVVPGQLREQWRWELEQRFGVDFEIVDRGTFSQKGSMGTWGKDRIITSIDFAKRNDVMQSLADARFDLVIVDEAHKMSAYAYGRTTSKTKRYHLGETLSTSSKHMLFLTATPHKGDSQNFRLLLDLLEPGFFAMPGMIEESVKEGNNPVFIRRAKEDMVGFDGTPLFVPRTVYTPDVQMTDPEKILYNNMSQYVTEQYNLATRSVKSHNITFALIILQRRFASSIYALVKSLRRRLNKLEQLESAAEDVPIQDITEEDMEKVDEMSEKDRWEEEQKWELISAAQNIEELRAEIGILAELLEQAQQVIGSESKLFQLKETLENLDNTYPDEKILVFTESKDTLDYLVQHIRTWGYEVNTIHGSMSSQERKDAEAIFRDKSRVMVATEAAGEGINLQFCRLMVNYDLPWNPNRLEQRMGRIHRYGQKLPVFIFNLVAADTREGEILVRLFEKLDSIRSVMGNDKIFDVISDIVPGKSLSQLLLDATVRAKNQKQIISELDEIVGDTEGIKNQMHDNFTSKRIDNSKLKGMQDSVNEKRLVPEYARSIFCDIITAAGGKVQDGKDYEGMSALIQVPSSICPDGAESIHAVFDADAQSRVADSELVTFGHHVFDAALQWAVKNFGSHAVDKISVARDHKGRLDGYVMFYTADILYDTGEVVAQHMVACMIDRKTNEAKSISPSVILDLDWDDTGGARSTGKAVRIPKKALAVMQEAAAAKAADSLESHAKEMIEYGRIQADMAQKYGLRSLDFLLDAIEADIMRLLEKKRRGIKADLAIHNKRRDRKKYRVARYNLERRMESDMKIKVGSIAQVGMISVVPDSAADTSKKNATLSAVMAFEIANGRVPKNVSGKGHGFDIRSVNPDKGDTRHILAAAETDEWVEFTANEWLKAKTMHDGYYIYLFSDKRGKILQMPDPAHTLVPTRHGSMYRVQTKQVSAIAIAQQ